jgi:hypothetical protein
VKLYTVPGNRSVTLTTVLLFGVDIFLISTSGFSVA